MRNVSWPLTHQHQHQACQCLYSILYDRVERAIEAKKEAHVVLNKALKAVEASLQEARDTLDDKAPGGDSAYT